MESGLKLWGIMTSTAIVLSDDAPTLVKAAARLAKVVFHGRIQICDGVDDQIEIQAAIDAAGRTILGEGTFIANGDIELGDYTTLEGQGRGSVIKLVDGYGAFLNLITNKDIVGGNEGIVIKDIVFDGNGALCTNNQTAINVTRIAIAATGVGLTMQDCIVKGWRSYGMYVNESYNVKIVNNDFYNCGTVATQHGFSSWDMHQSLIEGNHCLANRDNGIEIYAGTHNTIVGNVCEDNENGIRLYSGSEYNTVAGNTCLGNDASGILVSDISCHNTVTGNNCSGSATLDGIFIWGSSIDNTITGNTCNGNARDGIDLCSTVGRNVVSGNTCVGNGLYGIEDSETDLSVISGNEVRLSGQHGIYLNQSSHGLVNANICEANSQDTDNTYDNIFVTSCDDFLISDNLCRIGAEANGPRYGINIENAASERNRAVDNDLYSSGKTGAFNDAGTDTRLPEIFIFYPEPDSNIGTHPALVLTDAADTTGRWALLIPMEFVELIRAQAIVVPGGTGNMRRSVTTNWGKIGTTEDYNASADAIAAGQVAVTINDLELIDIADALTGIAAGDAVGIEFTRIGTHIDDTVNADCYLTGFRMQYV